VGRKRPGVETQTLVPLNVSAVAAPLISDQEQFSGTIITILRSPYSTGFWCGAESFSRAQSTYMNSAYDRLKIFKAVYLRASIVYPLPKVQTLDS